MNGSASRPSSTTMNGTRWAIRPATMGGFVQFLIRASVDRPNSDDVLFRGSLVVQTGTLLACLTLRRHARYRHHMVDLDLVLRRLLHRPGLASLCVDHR